jgi:hypothetical protein
VADDTAMSFPYLVCPFELFLFAIVLSVLLRYTDSDYPFGIFKFLAIVLSVLLRYTDSDYPFGIFKFLVIKKVDI